MAAGLKKSKKKEAQREVVVNDKEEDVDISDEIDLLGNDDF